MRRRPHTATFVLLFAIAGCGAGTGDDFPPDPPKQYYKSCAYVYAGPFSNDLVYDCRVFDYCFYSPPAYPGASCMPCASENRCP